MARIPKSKLDIWDTREEVSLRKLAEDAFDQVSFDGLTDVDVLNPDDNDTIFYNFSNDTWENHPLKTINGESLKGPGDIVVTGGGGTPGGTSGQFQWNDSGAFGGTSGFTWNSGTNLPQSTNGYEFGDNSSIAEAAVGLSTISSMSFNPVSGLIAGVELESNGSTSCIVRLNTNRGSTNKFLQVENDKGSPRYFDGSGLQDVWHTGTFDPSTKQDTLVSGTNIKTINSESLLGSSDISIPVISSLGSIPGVVISSPTATQVLAFDGTNWVNSAPSGGGGLTHFTESVNTSAPNATVPVVQLLATNAATNVDVALTTKGTGALLAQIPDNTTTGGNKRGASAVDFQTTRNNAAQVALGPRSAIISGQNNTTTSNGTSSFIGAGIGNTVSNTHATVLCGNSNTASGSGSIVASGSANIASASDSGVVCGVSNQATASRSFVGGGLENQATGESSWIPGGVQSSTRGLFGAYSWSGARRSSNFDNQCIGMTVQGGTTNATPLILTAQRGAASTSNVMVLPNNSCWTGTVHITGRSSGAAVYYLRLDVVGARGANAAATTVKATNPAYTFTDTALVGVSAAVVANTTRGSLEVEVTGLAATTIDWFAHFDAGNQIVR